MSTSSDHLDSVGETYLEHLEHASAFGARMMLAGLACLIHGIFPALFAKTGSRAITELHDRMVVNRARDTAPKATIDVAI